MELCKDAYLVFTFRRNHFTLAPKLASPQKNMMGLDSFSRKCRIGCAQPHCDDVQGIGLAWAVSWFGEGFTGKLNLDW